MSDFFSVKSMAEVLTADKTKNGYKTKVYKELADEHKSEQISLAIDNKTNALKQAINAPKVDLSNTQEVQDRIFMYLEACSLASCFPSVMGLSGVLGCSRQNLNRWLLSHGEHPSAELINMAKDLMADILTNASLFNNANAIQSIFQLKNHFGHSDKVEIAPATVERVDIYDPDDIRRRYLPNSI